MPPHVAAPILAIARLHPLLVGATLTALLGPLIALIPTWEDDTTLIAEASDGQYRVALYARPASCNWALRIVVTPVIRAVAVLRLGVQVFRAPFDHAGAATVPKVPAYLLTHPDRPPLELRIEPENI